MRWLTNGGPIEVERKNLPGSRCGALQKYGSVNVAAAKTEGGNQENGIQQGITALRKLRQKLKSADRKKRPQKRGASGRILEAPERYRPT